MAQFSAPPASFLFHVAILISPIFGLVKKFNIAEKDLYFALRIIRLAPQVTGIIRPALMAKG